MSRRRQSLSEKRPTAAERAPSFPHPGDDKAWQTCYAPGVSGKQRPGIGMADVMAVEFAKPIEVPRCLTARQYIAIIEDSQPDP